MTIAELLAQALRPDGEACQLLSALVERDAAEVAVVHVGKVEEPHA
jgi:hypothetical protein